MEKRETITTTLPASMLEKIREIAWRRRVKINSLLDEAIEAWLKRQKRQEMETQQVAEPEQGTAND